MCVRLCVPYYKKRGDFKNSNESMESYKRFKQDLILGMTDFEKRMYLNPKTEKEVDNAFRKISGMISDSFKGKGKNLLEGIYRRLRIFSQSERSN